LLDHNAFLLTHCKILASNVSVYTAWLKVMKLSAKQVALVSVFAALIVIVTRLPGIPIAIGKGTGSIELSAPLYPLAGILLGPFVGAIAVLIGNFIAWLIPTSTMLGLLLVPAGAVAALISGFLMKRARWISWKLAAVVFAVLNTLWYLTPAGWEAPFYPIPLHFTALALILVFRHKIVDFVESQSRRFVTIGIALATFIGTMAEHMTGNLLYISALGILVDLKTIRDSLRAIGMVWAKMGVPLPEPTVGDFFMVFLPIAAVERIAFTAIATVIGVAVIRIIGRSRLLKT